MIARFTPCDRELLREVLHDDLSTVRQEQLETHLSTCDICRSELERLAGGDDWLTEVRDHLSSSEVPVYRDETSKVFAPLPHDDDLDHRPEDQLDFLDPSSDPGKLGRLGPYEVESVIGRGGMGIVLKAFDAALNRHVAIKVLAAELATSGAARRRFARESQAAAAIAHEHVVAIHAVDNSGKLPFLVMPYIPGKSLQERLDESGPLEIKEVLRIGLQAASGLAAAHAQGLVHRDIKPANILLENGIERVRITDFGLARAVDDASQTQSGFIAGTPQYMAPEQARGEPVDHRADLFSLGSVMYAMCTGRPPFRAETTFAVLRRICEETPRPLREVIPETPDWLQAIISRLHARDPAERFQSAAEVATLLEQYLAHLQQPATHPLPRFHYSFVGWRRQLAHRRYAYWAATALVVVGLVIAVRSMLTFPAVRTATNSPVYRSQTIGTPGSSESSPPTGSAGPPTAGIPPPTAATSTTATSPRIDPWQLWDNDLVIEDVALQRLEIELNRRLSTGPPIDLLSDLEEVAQQLEVVEADLKGPGKVKQHGR